MRKPILLMALLTLFGLSAMAQGTETWFHWTTDEDQIPNVYDQEQQLGLVGSTPRKYNVARLAIRIPDNWAGCEIKSMRFFIRDKVVLDKLECWISSNLMRDYNAEDRGIYLKGEVTVNVPVENLVDMAYDGQAVEIDFPEPYTVPSDGCYVGFDQFFISQQAVQALNDEEHLHNWLYPILANRWPISDPNRMAMSYYWGNESDPWIDLGGYSGNVVPTQVLLYTDKAINNAATITRTFNAPVTTLKGQEAKATAQMLCAGIEPVKTVSYVVTDLDTDEAWPERTITLDSPLEISRPQMVDFPLSPFDSAKLAEIKLEITKINGEANEALGNKTAKGELTTLDRKVDRRVLMEEFTGAWCGWCPRGAVAIEEMMRRHPEDFIPVATHLMDTMVCYDIQEFFDAKLTGISFPSCFLDRRVHADPYYGTPGMPTQMGIDQDFERCKNVLSEGTIDITSATLTDSIVSITTQAEFVYESEDVPFGICYMVTTDGLKDPTELGDGYEWWQENYFCGKDAEYANDPYLYPLTQEDPLMDKYEYNHVLVAANGSLNGVYGSVSGPLTLGKKQEHTENVSLIGKDHRIQDLDRLNAVAFIIDTRTGRVVNAAFLPVTNTQSGINAIEQGHANGKVTFYNLQGQQVVNPANGIYIMRQGDKTVKVRL